MPALDLNKRRRFVNEYAISGNGAEAARRAGVPERSAHAMAYKWLRNPDIIALLRDELDAQIRELGPLAVSVIKEIMLDPNASPQTRLTAARDMLDRLGWVPPKRAEMAPEITQKPVDRLTREELEEIIRRGEQAEREDAEMEGAEGEGGDNGSPTTFTQRITSADNSAREVQAGAGQQICLLPAAAIEAV